MYMNDAQISLTGYVATQPLVRSTPSGAMNVSMRVAWTPRRQDRVTGEWADGNTSYVTVICWRKLASNAGVCLRKGDPVVVKGRLSIREFDDKQGLRRTAVEVEAISVGHDLSRGVAQFQRVRPQTGMTAFEYAAAAEAGARSGIPGGGDAGASGSVAANGPAVASGSVAANGSAGADGSVPADGSPPAPGQAADGAAAGAEDSTLLELTRDGLAASPGSMGERADSAGTTADSAGTSADSAGTSADSTVSDEDVDHFLGEAEEAERSRDREPVGAPF